MTESSQLLMIDLSGPSLTADERAFLSERRVGGVCLFARNVRDRVQVADYTAELRGLCGDDLLIGIDQEGGGVVRALDVPYPPSAMALGAADDIDLTRRVAAATARGLRALGVNIDFAPVADVNNNPQNPVIADRAFGSDPQHVARQVVAFVQGMQAEGVAATVKHFPGHGDTAIDSHLALPRLEADLARLDGLELPPFRAAFAAGVAGVMSGHIVLPQLDPQHPATLSRPLMTKLLRDTLGFDGMIFTDALNMKAVADVYGPGEAAVQALAAGCDMPVHAGPLEEHTAILEAFTTASDEGRLDPVELGRSAQRVRRLARRYPLSASQQGAWADGDEALLNEAARRGLVKLGDFRALGLGSSLTIVAAARVKTAAASQLERSPAEDFAIVLAAQGFKVQRAFYHRETLEANSAEVLRSVAETDNTLFVSTGRTRMEQAEKNLASEVAQRSKNFVHVALWNPYHVTDVPGPALITFGFRPRSLEAAAEALVSGEATGRPPIPLQTI